MKLRAITVEGNPYYFDVRDCPVSINDKITILVNKEDSPLLITKSIVRGTDDCQMFESDFVSMKGDLKFLGFVVYSDGFYIYSRRTGTMTPIRNIDDLVISENVRMSYIEDLTVVRSPIRFSHEGHLFRLNRIMYSYDGELYIDIKETRRIINIDKVTMCTGMSKGKKELYFGQLLEDGRIVLHDYHPMVKLYNNTYRELEEDDYVSLGIT